MRPTLLVSAGFSLLACTAPAPFEDFQAPIVVVETGPMAASATAPPGADPNACFARNIAPAIIETETEQQLQEPAEVGADGTIIRPAVFVTDTRQTIVQDRREFWFETPCQADRDPAFIAALQRALTARGLYAGPIDGTLTAATQAAIRAYQAPQGLDSGVLSLAAARQLGLTLWDPLAASGGRGG